MSSIKMRKQTTEEEGIRLRIQGTSKVAQTGDFPAVHFQKKMELAYYLRHLSVGRSFTLSEERFG